MIIAALLLSIMLFSFCKSIKINTKCSTSTKAYCNALASNYDNKRHYMASLSSDVPSIQDKSLHPKQRNYDYHEPVMKEECMEHLNVHPGGVYVDCTLGGGGHTNAILERGGNVIALDQDPDAIAKSSKRLQEYIDRGQLEIHQVNFRYIREVLRESTLARKYSKNTINNLQLPLVDGVLLDLGISSYQVDEATRGFSFNADGPLDMRMNKGVVPSIDNAVIASTPTMSAMEVVNEFDAEDLANILFDYGEERRSRRIAREIAINRPIRTTGQLSEVIGRVTHHEERSKTLARCFQALRIYVNDELNALDQALTSLQDCVVQGGRLAVLSYHSLEDRRVKKLLRYGHVHAEEEPRALARVKKHFRQDTEIDLLLDSYSYTDDVDNAGASNTTQHKRFITDPEYYIEQEIKFIKKKLEQEQLQKDMTTGRLMNTNSNDLLPWYSVVRKAMKPTNEEVDRNRRSRSAKLRVAERNYSYQIHNINTQTTSDNVVNSEKISQLDKEELIVINNNSVIINKRKGKYSKSQLGAKQLRKLQQDGNKDQD